MVGPGLATTTFRSWLAIRYNFCVSTQNGIIAPTATRYFGLP
jgi:hypothetical protein